ncbi:class I SAM-dependent methyltransferase [Streptomyces sp. NPDC088812]|uniref:class I SAM-dependent methyltransferase n=1 Tax=Streptomyces sp. NPDC088812 TaxID=3365905 RepID=UPI0037FF5B67
MNPTTRAPSTPPQPPTAPPRLLGGPRSAQYDAFHTARARTDLVTRLYTQAMGDNYPAEVAASSSCDRPLLHLLAARLSMQPGQILVDAGCGTGGIGLWLARTLNLRLAGFDLSPVAVAQATARRPHFLGAAASRARFHVADLEHTGLADGCAHGIVCVDALSRATDRDAALRELARSLAPGGRLVLTRAARHRTTPAWAPQAHAAGLRVEHIDERPDEPLMWQRLYRLWIAHADELRRELGDVQAARMLSEAQQMLPRLPHRRAVLLTLARPAATPAAAAGPAPGATMTAPGCRTVDGPVSRERTPQ